ncbi:AI-2E family transporter [Flavitalea flava]
MAGTYNDKIRQVLLLAVMIGLALLLFRELYGFFPGFLGAITLYILSRGYFLFLTEKKGWNKSAVALLFMVGFLVCIGLPIYLSVRLLSPKINTLITNQQEIMTVLKSFSQQVGKWTGQEVLSDENIKEVQKSITGFIPSLLNSTASLVANLVMLLFLSFFMLINARYMEKELGHFIPLRDDNIDILAVETKNMVRANAIGIPLISIIQGVVALLGYWIFGIGDYVVWGFLTGVFAFFPILGTMIVWIPLVVYLFSTGHNGQGIGLTIYSAVVTGNIDYFARISLLKRIGNVHPLITVLGVIVGLKLFGFWGFIFGPLLVSYFLLLLKIYATEFGWLQAEVNKE